MVKLTSLLLITFMVVIAFPIVNGNKLNVEHNVTNPTKPTKLSTNGSV